MIFGKTILIDSSSVDVILKKFVGNDVHCVDLLPCSYSQYPAIVIAKRSANASVGNWTHILV